MRRILLLSLLVGGGCARALVGSEAGAGGIAVKALGAADGAAGVTVLYLPGRQNCPVIAGFHDGTAVDQRGLPLGQARFAPVRDNRVADANGGSAELTEDVFFGDVPAGPFTLCGRPGDESGNSMNKCETARAFGFAQTGHKTHVDLSVMCHADNSADVGSVVTVQYTPSIRLTGAIETGLAGCGEEQTSDLLTVAGNVVSPDGTASEFRVGFDGPAPEGVVLDPAALEWMPTQASLTDDNLGQFSISATNLTGRAAVAPIRISARTRGINGQFLYSNDYTLTLRWLSCENNGESMSSSTASSSSSSSVSSSSVMSSSVSSSSVMSSSSSVSSSSVMSSSSSSSSCASSSVASVAAVASVASVASVAAASSSSSSSSAAAAAASSSTGGGEMDDDQDCDNEHMCRDGRVGLCRHEHDRWKYKCVKADKVDDRCAHGDVQESYNDCMARNGDDDDDGGEHGHGHDD